MKFSIYISAFLVLIVLFQDRAAAQGNFSRPLGGKALALSGNTENFRDIHALFHNQAGLAFMEKSAVALTLERRFLLQGVQHIGLGFATPTSGGTFGVQVQMFGNKSYNEGKVGLAYARKLMEEVSIGGQVNYMFVQVEEGGSEGVFSFEAGINAQLLEKLKVGFHVFSPVPVSFSNDFRMPTILRLGLQYSFSDNLSLLAGAEKDIEYQENLKFGLEYKYAKVVAFRLGMQTFPAGVSFGFGVGANKNLQIDLASAWNQQLGFSPGLNVIYQF